MVNYIEHNLQVYDELSAEYKKKMQDYIDDDKITSALFRNYLKYNFNIIKVLELGPGSGLSLLNFEKEGFTTTGIDFSEKMLEIAKETTSKTEYILGNFLMFNFDKLKYTGIYAQAFIHLFPKEDAKKVFKKIFDLLEDNGVAHISTTVHDKSEEGYFEKDDYKGKIKRFRRKWNEDDLLREIENTGFLINDKIYITEPNNGKKWIIILAVKKNKQELGNK